MRFYFDFLSHNEEIRDCEGLELADWLTAHRHAVQIVKQTVPFLPKGLEWRGLRIQVRDECGRYVLSVLFPSSIEIRRFAHTNFLANELPARDLFGRRSGPAAHSAPAVSPGRRCR